jgi:hypothetical protein
VRNLTRHPLRKLFLIKSSIYCEFLLILGSYAQFSKSLSCCFSGRPSSEKWDFSSMFQSNLDLPLNNKSVHNNLLELLPKFVNFGGHRFRIMNFLIHNLQIYAMILCVLISSSDISLHLVRMTTPNVTHLRIKLLPFVH